jgi:exopolyphosphatase/guanosine-5'-triphosphate,3'-diphosphate pyrophosphatase
MNELIRTGIIDIGSNSIRLVIYETNASNSYRVIDEAKLSARLSEHIDQGGRLPQHMIAHVGDTLHYFKRLCEAAGVSKIHAVATAAIRNAKDSQSIVEQLNQRSGLDVQILTGEQEAHYGFLGLINTMDITSGYLIDIGGGSTELTLIINRRKMFSYSFPFGAVQLAMHYPQKSDHLDELDKKIQALLQKAAIEHPWIRSNPGLPMYGLGGTVRTLANIHMKQIQYSLPLPHQYAMSSDAIDTVIQRIRSTPLTARKNIEGLSKNRSDIILPGSLILQTFFQLCSCSHYIVSASGLRDGVFFQEVLHAELEQQAVLAHSVRNLLHLHPYVPVKHVNQTENNLTKLLQTLSPLFGITARNAVIVRAASLLYRIGISIHYYNYNEHTHYLITHSRLNGLTHREITLCASIASFKNKKNARKQIAMHSDLLGKDDLPTICQLGLLLQLAIALDRSETQSAHLDKTEINGRKLLLHVTATEDISIESRQIQLIADDFHKEWNLQPILVATHLEATSSKS